MCNWTRLQSLAFLSPSVPCNCVGFHCSTLGIYMHVEWIGVTLDSMHISRPMNS